VKALTVWQPWATLIMIGAKPYEFRRWDYRTRQPGLENQRIWIHAGSRPIRLVEIDDIIERMDDGLSSLKADKALPLLERIRGAYKGQGVVELSAVLGSVILGTPISVTALFNSPADSNRIDHHMWAWPLTDISVLTPPVPMRGAQGFWSCLQEMAA
jgi:ASCH domain